MATQPVKAQTNETKKVELPSSIHQVRWSRRVAAVGAAVGLEVFTHYVGNGSDVEIELADGDGKKHGSFKEKIAGNRIWASIVVPPKAKKAMVATVKLPKHGLEKTSAALFLMEPIEIKNAKWDREEVRRGDVLTMTADIKGAADGTDAHVSIWECDAEGAHDLVAKFPVHVQQETIEAAWEFEYHDDTDDIVSEGESEQSYLNPEYFFRMEVAGIQADSPLVKFKDWIEVSLTTFSGRPQPRREYILHMPDGSTRHGKLDDQGGIAEVDIPPGPYRIEFV